jgi:oligopeptide/dipeptide ABC transporter ATP-binding protein
MSAGSPALAAAGLRKLYPLAKMRGLGRNAGPNLLHAVDGVSLAIRDGETVGLVGESGCGKSTLARLLARLIDPTAGTIQLDGEEISSVSARRFGRSPLRAHIQMVFQDAADSLNPRYTAFRAIADPLLRLRRLSQTALRARVEEAARLTGLPRDLLTRFPHQLSGGQKARVGIARAIAVEPRVLILDEPTSALDVSLQVVILQLLADLKQTLELSYLFVSHDLNIVRLLCDRILVMYLGHIVESGPAEPVFTAPMHPYTRALLSAVPKIGSSGRKQRISLPGEPRSPVNPAPDICPLYGRCGQATELCKRTMPPLREIAPGRFTACHFPIVGAGAASTTQPTRSVSAFDQRLSSLRKRPVRLPRKAFFSPDAID